MSDETGRIGSEAPDNEAVAAVLARFEAYVDDFETQLEHGARAGTVGEDAREEAERLEAEYRRRIEHAADLARAEEALASFMTEAQRLRP